MNSAFLSNCYVKAGLGMYNAQKVIMLHIFVGFKTELTQRHVDVTEFLKIILAHISRTQFLFLNNYPLFLVACWLVLLRLSAELQLSESSVETADWNFCWLTMTWKAAVTLFHHV